jgi:hypothetical protein
MNQRQTAWRGALAALKPVGGTWYRSLMKPLFHAWSFAILDRVVRFWLRKPTTMNMVLLVIGLIFGVVFLGINAYLWLHRLPLNSAILVVTAMSIFIFHLEPRYGRAIGHGDWMALRGWMGELGMSTPQTSMIMGQFELCRMVLPPEVRSRHLDKKLRSKTAAAIGSIPTRRL